MCLYELTTVTGIRRGRSQILRGLPRNICDPTSSNSGMFYVKKRIKPLYHSYVFLQPTNQFWGLLLKAPWSYVCGRLCRAISLPFCKYLLRKDTYRDFFISSESTHNKQQDDIKSICTEERGKVMTATNMFKFRWFQV